VTDTISQRTKSIILLQVSQAVPYRPSGKDRMCVDTSCRQWTVKFSPQLKENKQSLLQRAVGQWYITDGHCYNHKKPTCNIRGKN
jgi:hypothetical protein